MPNHKHSDQAESGAVSSAESIDGSWESSAAYQAIQRLQANSRVKYIVIAAPADACPACQKLTGTYPKDQVPQLPVESCSHPLGCRAFYLPYLDDIYP